jgi:hypothetical protein
MKKLIVVLYLTSIFGVAAAGNGGVVLSSSVSALVKDQRESKVFSATELEALRSALAGAPGAGSPDKLLAEKVSIEITINPEARVSARRVARALTMPTCNDSVSWLVRIVNQGALTSRINADVIGTSAIKLESLDGGRLTGAAVEYRTLRLRMTGADLADATLVFNAGPGTWDLGGRSGVPILLRCLQKG